MYTHRTLAVVGVLAASLALSACAAPASDMGMGGELAVRAVHRYEPGGYVIHHDDDPAPPAGDRDV